MISRAICDCIAVAREIASPGGWHLDPSRLVAQCADVPKCQEYAALRSNVALRNVGTCMREAWIIRRRFAIISIGVALENVARSNAVRD